MKEKKKEIIPENFFNEPRNIISTKEALKDVHKVDWNEDLKERNGNENQVIQLEKEVRF